MAEFENGIQGENDKTPAFRAGVLVVEPRGIEPLTS